MTHFSLSGSTGKQVIISLRGLSHEVCAAATQNSYWQQLTRDSSISITSEGNYVPVELESICSDDDEPRLHLIVKSQHEKDNKQFDTICTRLHYDLMLFENNDRPVYDADNHQMIVYGSVYNSLPLPVFDTQRILLGQRNSNIKRIKNSLACVILIDESISNRYRFTIHHQKQTIMDLAVIQIQALVKQTQYHYLMAYALRVGQKLIGPIENVETTDNSASASDPHDFPAFTSFQPNIKRKRESGHEEYSSSTNATGPSNVDSDDSDDDESADERRYNTETFSPQSILTISPVWDDTSLTTSRLSPLLDRFF